MSFAFFSGRSTAGTSCKQIRHCSKATALICRTSASFGRDHSVPTAQGVKFPTRRRPRVDLDVALWSSTWLFVFIFMFLYINNFCSYTAHIDSITLYVLCSKCIFQIIFVSIMCKVALRSSSVYFYFCYFFVFTIFNKKFNESVV